MQLQEKAPITEGYSEDVPRDKWTRFPVRVRPHRNPLADDFMDHPVKPEAVSWVDFFPKFQQTANAGSERVEIVDIGCAYGGLLVRMAPLFPKKLMLGMEIRDKVVDFAQSRIQRLRAGVETIKVDDCDQSSGSISHDFQNVWIIRSNSMKYLPNFIAKGQLQKILFCFPDPHFKKRNQKRRIISPSLVPEYAYVLAKGGKLYIISDVPELFTWMSEHLSACPLFALIANEELIQDPLIHLIQTSSEDAHRAARKSKGHQYAVFLRI